MSYMSRKITGMRITVKEMDSVRNILVEAAAADRNKDWVKLRDAEKRLRDTLTALRTPVASEDDSS